MYNLYVKGVPCDPSELWAAGAAAGGAEWGTRFQRRDVDVGRPADVGAVEDDAVTVDVDRFVGRIDDHRALIALWLLVDVAKRDQRSGEYHAGHAADLAGAAPHRRLLLGRQSGADGSQFVVE